MTVSFLNGSDVHEYIHSFSQYFLNFYSTWCITSSVLYCAVYKVESDMGPVFLRVSRIKSMFMDNYNTINTVLNDIFKSWEKGVKVQKRNFQSMLEGGGIWESSGTERDLELKTLARRIWAEKVHSCHRDKKQRHKNHTM